MGTDEEQLTLQDLMDGLAAWQAKAEADDLWKIRSLLAMAAENVEIAMSEWKRAQK